MNKYDKFNNLVYIHRWAGWRVIIPESDADHVWGMNALAIDFVSGLDKSFNKTKMLKELIYRISLHDLGETFYVDIPRNFKYSSDELANLIHKTENNLIDENLPKEVAYDVKTAKSKSPDDPIGFIVAVFDAIQAGLKMKQELELGNQFFKDEILNAVNTVDKYLVKLNKVGMPSAKLKNYSIKYFKRYGSLLNDTYEKYKDT